MILFTPFVPEINTRLEVGYFCCAVEVIALVTNILAISSSLVRELIFRSKEWFAKTAKKETRPRHLRSRAKGMAMRNRRNRER
jgi:hypothetical protein